MKKADKMNFLYKISIILMFVCVVMLGGAFVVGLVLDKKTEGVLIAVAGCVLCVVAIVLAMFSKPKKPKKKVYRKNNSDFELNEDDSSDDYDDFDEDF